VALLDALSAALLDELLSYRHHDVLGLRADPAFQESLQLVSLDVLAVSD